MLFRRNKVKRDKTRLLKDVKAQVNGELKEIGRIDDPNTRVTRYGELKKKLWKFYNDGKPETWDGYLTAIGAVGGGAVGLYAAAIALAAMPHIAVPVALGIVGGSAITGGSGGARLLGTMGTKAERQALRARYGSIRNARAMYRLEKEIDKKTEQDRATLRSLAHNARLREDFNNTFRKKEEPVQAQPVPVPETPRGQPPRPTI